MILSVLFNRKLLGIALILSLLSSACSKANQSANAGAPPPTPVKLQELQTNQLEDSTEYVGTLEAQEKIDLKPKIKGRIDRIFVSSGAQIGQDTPIVLLSLDETEANLASADARVNSAKAAVGTAQAQLEAAEANRVKAAADLVLQQKKFNRTNQLVAEGVQAQQDLDTARANLETSQATLQAAEKQVGAANASLAQANAGVRQAIADASATTVPLQNKQVNAPITGQIGDFKVKVGDYVDVGQSLTTITRNDAFDMRIVVPSNRSSDLRTGLAVELLDAASGKRLVTGNVSFISPQVDTGAQGILIKARFPNQGGLLRDGQYVRARIIWSRRPGVLVPTVAVTRLGGQSFVFVAESDNSKPGEAKQVVHQRPVQLGEIQGDSYQVKQGVNQGDRIAVSNILKLKDGAPIQPQS